VGLRLDLAQYYTSLKHPGKYTLAWRPYGGTVVSAPLALTVMAERQAVITTEKGTMTIRFYYDQAPLTVENFIDLVNQKFYDRLTFHKIVPQGWIIGGDPTGTGRGGRIDGKRVKAEFNAIPFEAGTVAMAVLPNDPDSASSQFFITASRQPALNGKQTAFGYLADAKSMHTLELLMATPADESGHPLQPVVIRYIRLENVPMRDSSNPTGEVKTPTTRPAIIPDTPGGSTSPGGGDGSTAPTPATRPAEAGDGQKAPEGTHEGQ
jgi:cyclophilin family peptidyl-prolyl cis-trans isomerase